jgi:dihydroorotase
MTLHLKGGKVVDLVRGDLIERDLFVHRGRIVEPPANGLESWRVIDCSGLVLSPGFVELYADMPDFQRDERCAIAGGYAQVVLDPASSGVIDTPTKVREIERRLSDAKVTVHVAGATTEGLLGEALSEMGSMLDGGCLVLSAGRTLVQDSTVLRNMLAYAGRFGRPIFLRAGEASWEERGVIREGARSVLLGLPGVPTESEEVGMAKLMAVVRLTGAHVHVTRVWTRRGIEAIRRAKAEGLSITASTTTHHLTLSDALIEENAYMGTSRWVPPLGGQEDREALLAGLRDGTIDAVATDHRPLAPHRQMLEMQIADSGAVGLQTALPLVLEATGSIVETCRYLSAGPSRVLGFEVPQLLVGERADIAIIDTAAEWLISSEVLCSRTNTPMLGRTVRGRVVGMLIGGEHLSA